MTSNSLGSTSFEIIYILYLNIGDFICMCQLPRFLVMNFQSDLTIELAFEECVLMDPSIVGTKYVQWASKNTASLLCLQVAISICHASR